MARILVVYYSRGGLTARMAELVAEGVREVEDAHVDVRQVAEVDPHRLVDYDGIICGSPTYYAGMAAEVKDFWDQTVKIHGLLENKVGGAFTSAANLAGGNETTLLAILHAMFCHGMILKGTSDHDHFGPVALNDMDDRAIAECRKLGRNVAALAVRLHA
jgi:NAD(P)H dehydrogenase (quinone)